MEGNTREWMGMVTGVDTTIVYDSFGRPVAVTGPEVTVDVPDLGTFSDVAFTDDVVEACELVGSRVRVTMEVVD